MKKCRICRWFEEQPYLVREKNLFEQKCREGMSLRKLSLLLEAFGLKARKDLISKHIKNCMRIEIKEQRKAEKSLRKRISGKLSGFWIKPPIVESPECKHERTTKFFNMLTERVNIKCLDCGKIISTFDPEAKPRKNTYRDTVILNFLRRERNDRRKRRT